MMQCNGVEVFSATRHDERNRLGDVVTDWLRRHPKKLVQDVQVRQSSDSRFHCLSIIVLYWEDR